MPILDPIAKLVLSPHYQDDPPPVKAEWCFPSMAFSAVDDCAPPPELIQLGLDAVKAAANEVSFEGITDRPGAKMWVEVWPGEHYKLLAGLVKVLRPKIVIEIGTAEGNSALCMKKYLPPDGAVHTFDIQPWREREDRLLTDADFADGRLVQHIGDLADKAEFEKHRSLMESAEFFFIDGPKDNEFEYRLLEHMKTVRFRKPPVVLFDDIRLWSMLHFWRVLPYPKIDLTSFGHSSGSGLLRWVEGL